MDIRTEKIQLIHQILQIKDATLITSIKNLLSYGLQSDKTDELAITDFWINLNDRQKAQIELSIKQLEAGKGIEHQTVMTDFRKRLY